MGLFLFFAYVKYFRISCNVFRMKNRRVFESKSPDRDSMKSSRRANAVGSSFGDLNAGIHPDALSFFFPCLTTRDVSQIKSRSSRTHTAFRISGLPCVGIYIYILYSV